MAEKIPDGIKKLYSWDIWNKKIIEHDIIKETPKMYRLGVDCYGRPNMVTNKTDFRYFKSKKALIKHRIKEAENDVETIKKRLLESNTNLLNIYRWANAEFNKLAGEKEE